MIGIYCITNKINNKKYIGASTDLDRRKKEHIYKLKNNKHFNTELQRDVNKYGLSNFDFTILDICTAQDLDKKERYYINNFNTMQEGYNKHQGGNWNSIHNPKHHLNVTDEDRLNQSIKSNSSNFLNVDIRPNPNLLQGYEYRYRRRYNIKTTTITSIEIYDLKQKVEKKNMPFKCLNDDAVQLLEESKRRCLCDKYTITKSGVQKQKNATKTMWALRKNGKKFKRSVDKNKLYSWIYDNCTQDEINWFEYREHLKQQKYQKDN